MNTKKKNKQIYKKSFQTSQRNEILKQGFEGFLVSCSEKNKEARAAKEIKSLIQTYV